jgi:nucleotide-binding universal stress UspA family protein
LFKKILIATDGSDHAKHALNSAIEAADKYGAELIILTVVSPLSPYVYAGEIGIDLITKLEEDLKEYHRRILSEAAETVKAKNLGVFFSTRLEEGHPDTVIVEIAKEEDVDLIVMGSRGLGGVTGLLLGSTSRHVVETSTKPLLIVK